MYTKSSLATLVRPACVPPESDNRILRAYESQYQWFAARSIFSKSCTCSLPFLPLHSNIGRMDWTYTYSHECISKELIHKVTPYNYMAITSSANHFFDIHFLCYRVLRVCVFLSRGSVVKTSALSLLLRMGHFFLAHPHMAVGFGHHHFVWMRNTTKKQLRDKINPTDE